MICHPERTLDFLLRGTRDATCAAFIEESRMKFADPTKLNRKSGEVEGSAVSFFLTVIVTNNSLAHIRLFFPGE
jgi:hypothetical protein